MRLRKIGLSWSKVAAAASITAALWTPALAWAQGPTGIGALQIGLTKAQVLALPSRGVHLAAPMLDVPDDAFSSTPAGTEKFSATVMTPWRSEPMESSLTFEGGKLALITLRWRNDSVLMTTVIIQISEKFGPPKESDERRVESCPTSAGASEQVHSGMLTRSWKQTNGKRVILTGATTLASDSCLGRREGKEPSAINMLLISAVDNLENPF
ncbi:hypothetical protein [Xanthomonas oryzae]|uniref:hypothetical protein n=1 Tax=Xanthomonas oryzae TaxID=347 RepID=UPI00125594BB|nr:hypothetical protein [Xanthomonas oryzae]QEO96964.1 hypothetical protein XOCgx_1972 [Xanthomonas oryzae pv. oryzicola]